MPASRLLAVISSDPGGPVVRHRWRAYETHLARSGIVLEIVPWPKRRSERRLALQRASAADGVVLSSRLLSVRDTGLLRRRARRLAFDFDDALPFRDSARGATPSRTRGRRFRASVAAADRVLAGNTYLRELALQAGKDATVIPTTVHVPDGPPEPEPAAPPLLMGWIGARATLPYLEALAPVLSALVGAEHSFRVCAIADARPAFPPGILVESVAWEANTWPAHLSSTHFGLAPVPEDAWTRGKCGLKVLQMLSLGRPVVGSAVGVQKLQIRSGETGFLADDDESFLAGILKLMDDPQGRREMGAAGREDVRANWSVAAWAPRVVEEVEALLA